MDNSNTELKISKNPQSNNDFSIKYFPQSDALANSLTNLFPEQQYEDKTFKKAKEILGERYTNEEVKSMIASFEYLINNCLEDYEKKVFNNKTLKEILQNL